jgi:hypothetical protein
MRIEFDIEDMFVDALSKLADAYAGGDSNGFVKTHFKRVLASMLDDPSICENAGIPRGVAAALMRKLEE